MFINRERIFFYPNVSFSGERQIGSRTKARRRDFSGTIGHRGKSEKRALDRTRSVKGARQANGERSGEALKITGR